MRKQYTEAAVMLHIQQVLSGQNIAKVARDLSLDRGNLSKIARGTRPLTDHVAGKFGFEMYKERTFRKKAV